MTFEEIQKVIEGMLAVQRELQEGQLKLQEESQRQREDINALLVASQQQREDINALLVASQQQREDISVLVETAQQFIETSVRHDRRIGQLIGYSITGESDRLNLEQRLVELERRLSQLEQGQGNS